MCVQTAIESIVACSVVVAEQFSWESLVHLRSEAFSLLQKGSGPDFLRITCCVLYTYCLHELSIEIQIKGVSIRQSFPVSSKVCKKMFFNLLQLSRKYIIYLLS